MSNIESNLATETLVGIGWDGRPTPRVAAEWQWLDDQLGLRLKLHPSIKFHDGTPLNAELARTILTDAIKAALEIPGSNVSLASISRIDAEGDLTLVLHLSRPEAFLLTDLAGLSLEHPQNRSLGTGPYMRIPVNDGPASEDVVRLAAFGDYYRGRPAIDFVELNRFQEQRSAWAALLRGNIDAVHEVSPSATDFVQAQTTVKMFPHTRAYYMSLMLNMRHSVLKNAAVRQALSQAVDRQTLVNVAFNGRGIPADGPLWPMHWAYSTAQRTYSFNPEAATLRLDAAGFKVAPRSGAMPSRFRFTCVTLANDARYEKIANVLQQQFHDVGVDMEVEAVPYKEMAARIRKGQFDAILLERTSGRTLAWTYLTFHSSATPLGYSAADRVLDRLRRATADNEIRAGVSDLQDILHDDPPAVFLLWPIAARAVSTKFVVPEEPGRDVMGSLWQWRAATPDKP
jgi:peptide/nickel transport system substrate-binding protein